MSASVVVFRVFADLQPKRGFSRLGWVCLHWIHRFQASTPYWLFSFGTSTATTLLEEVFWDVASAALDKRWELRPLNKVERDRGAASCKSKLFELLNFQWNQALYSYPLSSGFPVSLSSPWGSRRRAQRLLTLLSLSGHPLQSFCQYRTLNIRPRFTGGWPHLGQHYDIFFFCWPHMKHCSLELNSIKVIIICTLFILYISSSHQL